MMLTAFQVTSFFEGASQMDIPHNTRVQLQSEYITDPSEFVDFTEEAIAMISQNLRRTGGGSKIRILTLLQEHLSYLELRIRCVPYQHVISCGNMKLLGIVC